MRGCLACAALLAAAAAFGGAQEPRRPTFRLDANYVRVDLYATLDNKPVDDLRADEIELLEDRVPQKIEAFERVTIRPSLAADLRRDPTSVSEARAMAADPRRRVLVIFFDTFHIRFVPAHGMQKRLVQLLETAVGDDDLVALMHPKMPARSLTLGRKTTVITKVLGDEWAWGERDRETTPDPVEEQWLSCYGHGARFDEMRARRRETMTLDALSDLVAHVGGLREGRTAVLLVSEGWQLFGENRRLAAAAPGERPPSGPGIFVGPTGKIQTNDPRSGTASRSDCDTARMQLAFTDNRRRLQELAGEANRANVTFYTINPAGLEPTTSATAHLNRLRELADATDGVAIINTNDISGAMRRVVSDLTSYYLLGYYSTNTTHDGKFRSIAVRVKRPGMQVRARRGYRALTREEAARLRATESAASNASAPAAAAVSGILHRPDEIVNPVNLASLRHVVLWKRGPSTGREYVATEDPRVRRTERLRVEHATTAAGSATARMVDATGKPMAVPVQVSERPDPSGNYRWIVIDATLAPLAPGEYSIQMTIDGLTAETQFQIVP